MSKILSKTKSVGLNFILLFCICLSLLPLRVVAQTIDFSHTTIREPIDIDFWERHLQEGIEIDSSFGDFPRVIFHRPIDFRYLIFDSSVSFRSADFHSTADFLWTNFKDTADFRGATFDSSVIFEYAGFHSLADFWRTNFKGTADFWRTNFKGAADFSGATFDSTAYFGRTKFNGKADFREAHFWGNVTFSNAILPDILDLRDVKDIRQEIDFTLSRPPLSGGKCYIALTGADISKIKLNMVLSTLWFPNDTTFVKSPAGKDSIIRIESTSYDGQLSVYESVLKKLKDDSFMESYQILDIDYRRFKYKHGGFFDWYILDTVQQWWWNYGYRKERVFTWTILFWFLFSFINLGLYRKLSESVYRIPFLEEKKSKGSSTIKDDLEKKIGGQQEAIESLAKATRRNRLAQIVESILAGIKKWIFYWLHVVIYTGVVFFGLKMDVAKFKKGVVREHPYLFAYLIVVYVFGVLCIGGFIMNIISTR